MKVIQDINVSQNSEVKVPKSLFEDQAPGSSVISTNVSQYAATGSQLEDLESAKLYAGEAKEAADQAKASADSADNSEKLALIYAEQAKHYSEIAVDSERFAIRAESAAILSEASAQQSSASATAAKVSEDSALVSQNAALASEQAASASREVAEQASVNATAQNTEAQAARVAAEAAKTSAEMARDASQASANASQVSAVASQTSADASEASAKRAEASEDIAQGYVNAAKADADRAEAAATAAAASELASETSAVRSDGSAAKAKVSEDRAAQSATEASESAGQAFTEMEKAQNSANAAAASETAAATSASNASTSEDAALASKTAAKVSETNSKASETNAATSESNASASELAASGSAGAAASSATAASNQASNAAASAASALVSENAAKSSEDASHDSEVAAKASADKAAVSETNSKGSETAASASAAASAGSATSSAGSASDALISKNAAKVSETNAKTSEGKAKTSETNAKNSEIAAKTSETSAESDAAKAAASAVLSEEWAISTETENSARHWAEVAKVAATSAIVNGGLFTPSAGAEYPSPPSGSQDVFWAIRFSERGQQYTYTTGDLDGTTVKSQDSIYFARANSRWTALLSSASGAVFEVNGKTGNTVNLTSADVGAVSKAGDTMTGDLTIRKLSPKLWVNNEPNKDGTRIYFTEEGKHGGWIGYDGIGNVVKYGYRASDSDGVAFSHPYNSSQITFEGAPLTNAVQSSAVNALTRKDYVDGTFLPKTGGTLTGTLVSNPGSATTYSFERLPTYAGGTKTLLRKFRGGNADTIWHETVQGGYYRLATGNEDNVVQLQLNTGGQLWVGGHLAYTTKYKPTWEDVGGNSFIGYSKHSNDWIELKKQVLLDHTVCPIFKPANVSNNQISLGDANSRWKEMWAKDIRGESVDVSGKVKAGELGVLLGGDSTTGKGLDLYGGGTGGMPTYGIAFSGTAKYGKHGSVQSDWATYFTMSDSISRGWIFKRGTTNVASVSGEGNAEFNGRVLSNSKHVEYSCDWDGFEQTAVYNIYKASGVTFTNAPPNVDFGTLEVIGRGRVGKSFVTQRYTQRSNGLTYIRTRNDGGMAWTPWQAQYSQINKPTWADVGGNDYFEKMSNNFLRAYDWIQSANDRGIIPYSTNNGYVGTSSYIFKEAWVNMYRGADIDITGRAKLIGINNRSGNNMIRLGGSGNVTVVGNSAENTYIDTKDSIKVRQSGSSAEGHVYTTFQKPTAADIGAVSVDVGDARWMGKTAAYTKAESDGRFVNSLVSMGTWDTLGKSGFVNSSTGGPSGSTVYFGFTASNGTSTQHNTQLLGRDGRYFFRSREDGVNSPFYEIYHAGHKPGYEEVGGNAYIKTHAGGQLQVGSNKFLRAGTISTGFLPDAEGTGANGRGYLGNSANWFKEAWVNSYRGGSVNVTGAGTFGNIILAPSSSNPKIEVGNATTYVAKSGSRLYVASNDAEGLVVLEGKRTPKVRISGTDTNIYHDNYHPDADKIGGVEATYNVENKTMKTVFKPKGGEYRTQNSSATGAIRINLPNRNSTTMITFKVVVYDYKTGESFECRISGYNYSDGKWHQCSAYMTGGNKDLRVRFGDSGGKNFVLIGEPTTTWSYPQVTVTEASMGFNNADANKWHDGWSIAIEAADLSEDVNTSIVMGRQYTTQYKPTITDLSGSVDFGTF